jgi:lipopolysaccharide export system protein LptA
MSMWIFIALISVLGLWPEGRAYSSELREAKTAYSSTASTTITAQKMTVRNQDSKAIFEGAVVLIKGSLVVRSDRMVVSFRPAETDGKEKSEEARAEPSGQKREAVPSVSNRSVSMIEATGRVKIEKDDGRATCQKAVYYQDEEKIVLTGDPVAWQKGTRVSGKRITMFLAEDRSVVEGGSHVTIEGEAGVQ